MTLTQTKHFKVIYTASDDPVNDAEIEAVFRDLIGVTPRNMTPADVRAAFDKALAHWIN